ncbi:MULTISPECIES: efflux RND transporter periplasmic adaptor subunit [unclassified Colwellia]|uniref:efflux RND transporter periplasmic adaptor subunit n=1 Tax=unclassified Colwellia TaxID=196834 RepID=UPI0015F6D0E3|nr:MULTISPECIES: efflux RND transporter periplasmic adaptor subunit [unclassified Colwellia]MBA6234378.1 efflux RND transporter periplasmic adaptor subunit [Colwellia sp. MB02u-7]MBA6237546.1 efflux RND transporter periplasmic adaptor subunit [Colwellia sp. MB02u-11]MBA6256259.1 efflux RND transporter periplasmic adaptor subunit [Colwellia sp. MB3u-28]MBA6260143.1 efflux RND transporter periplasmic adaptor subunit [Colwellia sp. MB3u-41]MBA6300178.1 efflux RND transporter periplasmic adaptor s
MKSWNSFVRFLIAGIIISASFSVLSQSYDLEQVIVEPYADTIKRTGKLDFKRTLNLSFKSSGYLTELSVDEGQYFEKNQLLASLDTTELLQNKNATYAQLLQAKREVNRQKKLLEHALNSEQDLDIALTQVETTRAAYQIAFYNFEKAQVIAPFSGVVLNRYTELGELQSPGHEILKIAALDKNWVVKVALTGSEVSQVRLGQKVNVSLQALGVVIGEVSKIPAIANTDGNMFIIEVLLPNLTLKSGLVAGQIAEITIDFTSDNFVYRLPISALISVDDNGQAIVITKNDQELTYQHYDIYRLDNQFLYLFASVDDQPIQIVTSGWQHIKLGE